MTPAGERPEFHCRLIGAITYHAASLLSPDLSQLTWLQQKRVNCVPLSASGLVWVQCDC